MLSTNKLRNIYAEIQNQLFYMIPERWEKIFLYASISEGVNKLQTGEMFFYYYPTGILKKEAINVYEIPNKFNIDEQEYMKLVDKLYSTIKELKKIFEESKEETMWTNLTIIIKNHKFNVEYSYDDLLGSKYSSYDRHIIWKCKYLDFSMERLSKKDRDMVQEYYKEKQFENSNTKTYTEGVYNKKVHNIVEYDREQLQEFKNYEEENANSKEFLDKYELHKMNNNKESQLDKYQLYKLKKEEQKIKEKQEDIGTLRNQILKM